MGMNQWLMLAYLAIGIAVAALWLPGDHPVEPEYGLIPIAVLVWPLLLAAYAGRQLWRLSVHP